MIQIPPINFHYRRDCDFIMAPYLAMRIEMRKLDYNRVVKKFPKYKDDIDTILAADGYEIDENGKCVKYDEVEKEENPTGTK